MYYRILWIAPGASEAEVRRAYWRRARETHPDHNPDSIHFHEVQNAYEVLSGRLNASGGSREENTNAIEIRVDGLDVVLDVQAPARTAVLYDWGDDAPATRSPSRR